MPTAAATTVTLSQVPQWILVLSRGGVVQSLADGHYTLAGSTITFSDAFSGSERVVVDYASTSYTPVPPINGSGISDGTITTAKLADRSVTNVKLASDTARSNLLTNGSLAISQRGSGPFSTNSLFICDRWLMSMGSGSTYSAVAIASLVSASPSGGSVIGISGSYVHSSNSYLAQTLKFSDIGAHLRLTQVAFSMRVYANAANAVRIRISGDGTGITPATSAFHPGNGTWQTLTVTSNVIPSDANSVIAQIEFAASTSSWGACMAMLVVGSVPADYAPLHPAEDLARCQRYYQIACDKAEWNWSASGAHICGVGYPLIPPMPVVPTLTKIGTWGVANCSQPVVVAGSGSTFRLYTTATAAGQVSLGSSGVGQAVTAEANP
jgi:hypothetical protein